MTKFKRIEIIEQAGGFSSIDGKAVDAWQFGGTEPKPDWLPAVTHTVALPHIGNPDWTLENFVKNAVWLSTAYPDDIYVGTPQGWHRCTPGQWVTHDDKGDLRVVTSEEFASYYRRVADPQTP